MGVCCPDDIALSGLAGSQIILDLPGGGEDYENNDNTTGNVLLFTSIELYSNFRVYNPCWLNFVFLRQIIILGKNYVKGVGFPFKVTQGIIQALVSSGHGWRLSIAQKNYAKKQSSIFAAEPSLRNITFYLLLIAWKGKLIS